jgi:hypothetical protein
LIAAAYGYAIDSRYRRHAQHVELVQDSPCIVEDGIEFLRRGKHGICFDISAAAEVSITGTSHDEAAEGLVAAYGIEVCPEL